STSHVFNTYNDGPDNTTERQLDLHPADHNVRTRKLANHQWSLATNQNSADTPENILTLVDFYLDATNGNRPTLLGFDLTMMNPRAPNDVGMRFHDPLASIDLAPFDIVTLNDGTLYIYQSPHFNSSSNMLDVSSVLMRDVPRGYDVLAIGNFRGT